MADIFSPERIVALCRPAARSTAIEIVAKTGSTNSDLLTRIDRLASSTLLVAEKQTAGRGRSGRTWHAEPGATLTFSLAWKFNLPVQALIGLSLAVGVALAEALATFGISVELKWPNDILRDGDKLAGTLIETAPVKNTSSGNATWAIIGVGLNIAIPESLSAHFPQKAADLPELEKTDRNLLIAALLNALSEALISFEKEGFGAFVARWNTLHAYSGQEVAIVDQGQVLHEGKAVGVDEMGRLLLDTASGRIAIMAGDVSLRIRKG